MPFFPSDLLFHALVLAFAAAACAHARSRGGAALAGAAAAFVAAGVLAAVLVATATGQGGFGSARLVAWVLFAYMPATLAVLAASARNRPWVAGALVLGALTVEAVAVDAFLVEPAALDVRRVRIVHPKLKRRYRIAVLADPQYDELGPREQRAFVETMALAPDLVLLLGDYVQSEWAREAPLRDETARFLRAIGFRAPLGAIAVRGNNDEDGWEELFAGTEVRAVERTTRIDVGDDLALVPLGLWDSYDQGLALHGDARRYTIAFGHVPDFVLGEPRVELALAGHTHGGQVKLPWIGPLVTGAAVPRRWAHGTSELPSGATLVISQGLGLQRAAAPRLRFLCRPEIVLLELEPLK